MLDRDLTSAIELSISRSRGKSVAISESRSVSGGCINSTYLLKASNGESFFVKFRENADKDPFVTEAAGLDRLSCDGGLRIPKVIAMGSTATTPFLILEFVQSARKATDFFEELGRGLAVIHRQTSTQGFGFDHSNFLGATFQPNEWNDNWVEFWAEMRLGFQVKLATQKGLSTPELRRLTERLSGRLGDLIKCPGEAPSLIHGDLWSGNYMSDEKGRPVLIDPAVYYAHREVEFGMTTLFGGFDDSFYAAYNEVFPMAEGYQERIEIYRLYHLLNHLNLFGTSYLDGCLQILKKYA